MANRKINELSVRTPSLTDLMIVGDPSTGYSFKATLAALNTLIDSSTSIGDLNGVVITSPTNGQALVYDGTNWVNQSISVPVTSVFGRTGAVVATEGDYNLTQLGDVTLTSPSSNQVLQYNGTAWVNATLTDNGITSLNGLTALSQTFATGSSGSDFAITSTTSTHTFNLPTASAVNRGALSSADWSTFNSKVGGSGTSGQVAYWTGTSSQSGSNNLFWDNANNRLGIGTTSPGHSLTVNGDISLSASQTIRWGSSLGISKTLNQLLVYGGTGSGVNGGSLFHYWNGSAFAVGMQLTNNSNLILQAGGTFTDGGQRLQVTGDVLFKGSGNTSGTTALTVQNSDGTSVLRVRNDNRIFVTQLAFGTDYPEIYSTATGAYDASGGSLSFNASQTNYGVASYNFYFRHVYSGRVNTSGTSGGILQTLGFSPTSGTGIFNQVTLAGAINQTGGANGITRGILVNPTLTAAADWRSIEWSNNSGWGLYGAGTANNYLAGDVAIGTTTLGTATKLTLGGSETASSAIARGGLINTSLTASANNDVLVGLDINPTFTNGAFTGVSNFGLRVTTANAVEGARFTSPSGQFLIMPRLSSVYGAYLQSLDGAGTATQPLSFSSSKFVFETGNVLIGSTTDGGQKLQVTGNAIITGSGNTSATTALTVRNSDAANLFRVLNNGLVGFGNSSDRPFIFPFTTGAGSVALTGTNLSFYAYTSTQSATQGMFSFENTAAAQTSGDNYFLRGYAAFSPTSGTGTYAQLFLIGVINQTGGANGITRGLYINPTLTSAADWRSLEWSNNSGKGIWGVGTANNAMAGSLTVGAASNANASAILDLTSTTKGFLPPRGTNAQMLAITGVAGLVFYDTTNNKLNVYDGTNWVAVH